MKKSLFSFLNNSNKIENLEKGNVDYLSFIDNDVVRECLVNFFEKSIIENIPHEDLMCLIEFINKDVKNKVFNFKDTYFTYSDFYHTMNKKQLNSNTHKEFLKIIDKYFGKSAVKTLKQRKNINIFNLNEVHVLHQEIFDTFGEKFVNSIMNNDLTPESLMIIKDVLTDREKKADFKYLYDFYTKNIGDSHVDFERMIRGYPKYRNLIKNVRESNVKLNDEQKKTLIEILKDHNNHLFVESLDDVNEFYARKDRRYMYDKNRANEMFNNGMKDLAIDHLKFAFFENFFDKAMSFESDYDFDILNNGPERIYKFFNSEDAFKDKRVLNKIFSKEEQSMLWDFLDVVKVVKEGSSYDEIFDKLLFYCDKYEKKGNKVSLVASGIFDKLPGIYEMQMVDSLSTIKDINKRIKNKENGVSLVLNPRTSKGGKINSPVYKFEGANFAFLSTTNFEKGLSGNTINGDVAASWFEYENGTSQICCSYTNQDCLSNLEFNNKFNHKGKKVTYVFDDPQIFTMGSEDIYTPTKARSSNITSNYSTMFMSPQRMVMKSNPDLFNEIAINRYKYDEEVRYAGKLIPSAILCDSQITEYQAEVAQSFTKYCVENGLKPEGWQMPIIVVDKKKYEEINAMKAKQLINKDSEYFIHEDKNQKLMDESVEISKENEKVENKQVGKMM